jgi:hypothetical protein
MNVAAQPPGVHVDIDQLGSDASKRDLHRTASKHACRRHCRNDQQKFQHARAATQGTT